MMILREKRMRELIALKKMRQVDLAKAIGISPAYLCLALKGKRKLNINYSRKLIELFGADLMFGAIDWDAMHIRNPFSAGSAR